MPKTPNPLNHFEHRHYIAHKYLLRNLSDTDFFECRYCGHVMKRQVSMYHHIRVKHPGKIIPKPFSRNRCDICHGLLRSDGSCSRCRKRVKRTKHHKDFLERRDAREKLRLKSIEEEKEVLEDVSSEAVKEDKVKDVGCDVKDVVVKEVVVEKPLMAFCAYLGGFGKYCMYLLDKQYCGNHPTDVFKMVSGDVRVVRCPISQEDMRILVNSMPEDAKPKEYVVEKKRPWKLFHKSRKG